MSANDSATVGIVATAYYLPSTVKPIAEVFRDEDVPAGGLAVAGVDFQRDLGIEQVHVADREAPSALGLEAARRVLEKTDLDPAQLDLVVDFTSIPEDYVAPTWSAAGLVQRELGAVNALATAVNTGGCCSFHVALRTVCALMCSQARFKTALLFAGDRTPALNHTYYPITVTCDGGSAVLLKRNHPRHTILAVETASVGELHDVWYVPGIARRDPDDSGDRHLYMASDLDRFNEKVIPINLFMFRRVMRGALKRAGFQTSDVDYYIYPTFSTWDQASFSRGLSIPLEKIYTAGLRRHGHAQENDMVINYQDAVDEGLVKKGDLVMTTTNGAGFTWSAALIRH